MKTIIVVNIDETLSRRDKEFYEREARRIASDLVKNKVVANGDDYYERVIERIFVDVVNRGDYVHISTSVDYGVDCESIGEVKVIQ